ncbi:hypothetical protein BDV25DRAFT_160089 [Aspergillus avenaceus]|uniref:Uncharacterized protein n=1 Tax=Aspergillus avenaceus TaxID=36643 RepID=A0A5N6TMP5_ASPAV|nr:hypothetical protein BDV25DRAFT_160089 [Aspergillus avenaceus]
MFRLRTIVSRNELSRAVEGSTSPVRWISVSQRQDSPTLPGTNGPKSGSSSSMTSKSRAPRKTGIPPANLNAKSKDSERPRPQRVFDARSLGASTSGKPANIFKAPLLRNPRRGPSTRGRSSRLPAKPTVSRARKSDRPPRPKTSAMDEIDELELSQLEYVYRELAEREKPIPSRYVPQASDWSNLQETWPSFPMNVTASAAEVIEKLSTLSARYPNGYVPPYELGSRLFKGQFVRFLNEEEMSQAVEEAKKLSQHRADSFSQRKGDLVEPEAIGFTPLDEENRKSLIQSFVQGSYPTLATEQAGKSPVLAEVVKNLRNNESYQMAGKSSQFMLKVESLLNSGRPVKRV